MSDWAVGDLALCVKGGFIAGRRLATAYPVPGKAYKVTAVEFHECWNMDFLTLPDAPPQVTGRRRWGAVRFVKITPEAADEFDREIIAIMGGEKIPEHTTPTERPATVSGPANGSRASWTQTDMAGSAFSLGEGGR